MLFEIWDVLRDFFGMLGQHPLVLIGVVLLACVWLMRGPYSGTGGSRND
jgi:hypothetical protein